MKSRIGNQRYPGLSEKRKKFMTKKIRENKSTMIFKAM